MQKLGLLLIALAFIACIIIMFGALATESTVGFIVAIVAMVGCVLLLLQAIKDRTNDAEDDYYSKNIDQ